jgi:hypothetical protein
MLSTTLKENSDAADNKERQDNKGNTGRRADDDTTESAYMKVVMH